jgi:hypothetical protein
MKNLKNNHKQAVLALVIFLSTMFLACGPNACDDTGYCGEFGDGLGIAHKFEELQK